MVNKPSWGRYRAKNDPYNGMDAAITRPSFVSQNPVEEEDDDYSQDLLDAEEQAGQNLDQFSTSSRPKLSDSISDALREAEENQNYRQSTLDAQFKNSVKGKGQMPKTKAGLSLKLAKDIGKRYGPLGFIGTLILISALFLAGANSMLGPQISALFTEATDLQFTSYNMRNQRIMKYLLDGGDQIKISGFSKKYTNFSPWLKKRLAKNGIEVGKIDADGNFTSGQIISTKNTVLKYGDDIITASDFQTHFAQDANFREAYYRAKRGRIAGFFDDTADRFYTRRGATRDILDQFKSTGDTEADRATYEDTVNKRVTGTETSINSVGKRKNEETGEEENYKNGEDLQTKNVAGDTAESKARAMVTGIAGKVSTVGMPICTALRIANIASVTAMAYQIYQSIAYFLSFMEPISKTMAGEGNASAINESLNIMTDNVTSDLDYVDEDGTTKTKQISGSMLEATGAKLILGNSAVKISDADPFGVNAISKSAARVAFFTGSSNVVCEGVMAASAIMSLATTAIPGGTLAKAVIGLSAQVVGGIALTGVISLVIEAIMPKLIKMFASNIFEYYTGIPGGELFSTGAANSNFQLAQEGSALMPASKEQVARQNYELTIANAQEAETDRINRSPFDISSPNTFMGSLVGKFAFTTYTTSIPNMVASFLGLVRNSAAQSLGSNASALVETLQYTSTTQECENLPGTVCDLYGNPIVASDYSTIDITPDDPNYEYVVSYNLDDDGKIKEDSNLAKFITFCADRESPWGVKDANIMNALQSGNIVVNNLPILNDVQDLVNVVEDAMNKGWATGENCVNSSSNPYWDGEFKYYQRYVEDMRILSTMDNEAENPVTAYRNSYEEAHPIDTSFEGTLARISGNTKEDIAFLLEYAEYSTMLANYDPSTRYGYIEKPETDTTPLEKDTIVDNYSIAASVTGDSFKHVFYAQSREANTTC